MHHFQTGSVDLGGTTYGLTHFTMRSAIDLTQYRCNLSAFRKCIKNIAATNVLNVSQNDDSKYRLKKVTLQNSFLARKPQNILQRLFGRRRRCNFHQGSTSAPWWEDWGKTLECHWNTIRIKEHHHQWLSWKTPILGLVHNTNPRRYLQFGDKIYFYLRNHIFVTIHPDTEWNTIHNADYF